MHDDDGLEVVPDPVGHAYGAVLDAGRAELRATRRAVGLTLLCTAAGAVLGLWVLSRQPWLPRVVLVPGALIRW